MKLGIIGAMDVEVALLKNAMPDAAVTVCAGMDFTAGTLRGTPAVVVQCGVGKVNAALCVQILCDCFGVTHIVNTGVAGSLANELDIGDVVVSRDAMYHDFDCSIFGDRYVRGQVPGLPAAFPADAELIARACAANERLAPGHTKIGRVASGDQFVGEKTQKAQIVATTHALCTEMEGAAIAHAAYRNGIPFVILRTISDKADDSAAMDYPTFERIAAERCASIVLTLAEALREG